MTRRPKSVWFALTLSLAYGHQLRATESGNRLAVAVPATDAAPLPQVRIGLKIIPFRKIATKDVDGKTQTQHVAGETLRHTLRARLNQVNHFYVGDYHIESKPSAKDVRVRSYRVQLTIFRQFGPTSEVEETIGSLTVDGVLEPQADGVFLLNGAAFKRFRDKFNGPVLDLAAGYRPAVEPSVKIPVAAGDKAAGESY